MMKPNEKLYQELKKSFTDAEIAESYVISEDLTEEEAKAAHEEIKRIRFQRLREMTEVQRLLSDLMRFKFQMENYIENEDYSVERSFGSFLDEYAQILRKTKKELSGDLNIHYTKMSRLVNDKDEPNVELTYRLEKHSGSIISAIQWWRLLSKRKEFLISQDTVKRKLEAGKVKNALEFSA